MGFSDDNEGIKSPPPQDEEAKRSPVEGEGKGEKMSREEERGEGRDKGEEMDEGKEEDREVSPRDGREDREEDRDRDRGRRRRGHRDRDQRGHDWRRGEERERRRHRSRSPDRRRERRHRSRSPDRRRERRRDRGRDERRRSPVPSMTLEERKEQESRRQQEAMERDMRTVFVSGLATRVEERDVFDFFFSAGCGVRDVKLIYDKHTRRTKGYGYVELENKVQMHMALALSGAFLLGHQVLVKSSEAEKNAYWEAEKRTQAMQSNILRPQAPVIQMTGVTGVGAGALAAMGNTGPVNLLVRNVHPELLLNDLKPVFEPFGDVEVELLSIDAPGASREVAVRYKSAPAAAAAIQQLNGLGLAGKKLEVTLNVAANAVANAGNFPMAPPQNFASLPEETNGHAGEIDDDGDGGLKLTAQSRAALMARLAGSADVVPPKPVMPPPDVRKKSVSMASQVANLPTQGLLGPSSPVPTPCILLKNMFDAAEESEENWDLEIADETREECEKFGKVMHVFVDKDSQGFVYLKFEDSEAAKKAQQALHGRFFAGKNVVAEFQFAKPYDQHFKL